MKAPRLQLGDKIAIVSLSRGVLGEPFCAHELPLGEKRLKNFGFEVVYMPHAKDGIEALSEHPEYRAADLKAAFLDDSIKGIITAVGGDDTYRLAPILMEDEEFIEAVKNHPKFFMGFSDTTQNHLLLNKLGLSTFYGQAFLPDFCELGAEMQPYSKGCFAQLLDNPAQFEIKSSDYWCGERKSFGVDQLGVEADKYPEKRGYMTLCGGGKRQGRLFGGCIESLYDDLVGERRGDEHLVTQKYGLLPDLEGWREKILFLETSEEKPTPEKLRKMLDEFASRGILSAVQGIIVGKPQDEAYFEEYMAVWREMMNEVASNGAATGEEAPVNGAGETPVLFNVNFGHANPHCILPYDALTEVDFDAGKITVLEAPFAE